VLIEDFDVAGVASDGYQALEAARHVVPDLIVLDVNMPRLNGFQTMRALREAGSQTPVVFLSMFDEEETVAEAFRCGGRGYVLKTQLASDLASALDQVLLGRLFVPSPASLFDLAKGGGHAMQLHGGLEVFLDGLAVFFDLALRRGDATCVVSTEDVRDGLARRLKAAGWDVGGPSGHPRYRVMDAADGLSRLMRHGRPDPEILAEIASELDQYRRAASEAASARLTIFGNMSALLMADGNPAAALALENQWNRLTEGLPFLTLCGYPASCFHHAPDLWSRTCHEHWAVSHTSDV
jgi:CheY-like chemotaxis protein